MSRIGVEITIDGRVYPCRRSMGAAVRYTEETGREVSEISTLTDACRYLYCCVLSGCAVAKVPFEMSYLEFSDAVTPEDLARWGNLLQAEQEAAYGTDEQKKR